MNYRDDNERHHSQFGGRRDSDPRSRGGRSRGGHGQQEAFQQRGGQQGGYDPQDDVIYGYQANRPDSDFGGGEPSYRGSRDDEARMMGYGRGGYGDEGRGQQGRGYEGRDSWRTHGGGFGTSDLSDYGSNAPGAPWQTTPGARQYERHDVGGGFDQGRYQTSGRQGQDRGSTGHQWDPHYHQWREEQMRRLDEDYSAYNRERYQKFASEFDAWRSQRANASGAGGGTSSTSASSSGSGSSGTGPSASTGGKSGDSKQQS